MTTPSDKMREDALHKLALADENEGEFTCNVCGRPLRYGSRHYRCGQAIVAAERAARAAALSTLPAPAPAEPPPGLLESMALRYRHDFNLDRDADNPLSCGTTAAERRAILNTMRQLWEEVVGLGFYRPDGSK